MEGGVVFVVVVVVDVVVDVVVVVVVDVVVVIEGPPAVDVAPVDAAVLVPVPVLLGAAGVDEALPVGTGVEGGEGEPEELPLAASPGRIEDNLRTKTEPVSSRYTKRSDRPGSANEWRAVRMR